MDQEMPITNNHLPADRQDIDNIPLTDPGEIKQLENARVESLSAQTPMPGSEISVESIKAEWLAAVRAHTGLEQAGWQKKILDPISDMVMLEEALREDSTYWHSEGSRWGYEFYHKWGDIADDLLRKYVG